MKNFRNHIFLFFIAAFLLAAAFFVKADDEEDERRPSSGSSSSSSSEKPIVTTQTSTRTIILKDSDGDGLSDANDPHPNIPEIYIVEDGDSNGIVDKFESIFKK